MTLFYLYVLEAAVFIALRRFDALPLLSWWVLLVTCTVEVFCLFLLLRGFVDFYREKRNTSGQWWNPLRDWHLRRADMHADFAEARRRRSAPPTMKDPTL